MDDKKRVFKKLILPFLFLSVLFFRCSEKFDGTEDEKQYHKTILDLCNYLSANKYDTTQREVIFKNYIYFDYVLNDTSLSRIKKRTAFFDGLMGRFQHFIDSVGVVNLEAKPVRFFKNDTDFYEPFIHELKDQDSTTLAYYDKRQPGKPLGALLFEKKTH